MGKDSTPAYKTNSKGIRTYCNPWAFSVSDRSIAEKLNPLVGSMPVVIHYTQAMLNNPLAQDTDYTVDGVYGISKKFDESRKTKAQGAKSEGVRTGRIVKVSTKGNVVKTYEILMQVGDSGSMFLAMSTKDSSMYQCAIRALQSGLSLKVEYKQSFFELVNDSNYEILSISKNEVKGW